MKKYLFLGLCLILLACTSAQKVPFEGDGLLTYTIGSCDHDEIVEPSATREDDVVHFSYKQDITCCGEDIKLHSREVDGTVEVFVQSIITESELCDCLCSHKIEGMYPSTTATKVLVWTERWETPNTYMNERIVN